MHPWDLHSIERAFHQLVDEVRRGPVAPQVVRAETLRELAERYPFDEPRELDQVVDDVHRLILYGNVHTTHTGYFGLFNPHVTIGSVMADLMAAGANPQIGAWFHSPAAVEMEEHVLRFFARKLGYDDSSAAHFTSGGSEANLTGVLCALGHAFPEWRRGGLRALPRQPVLFASVESHHSFEKIAHETGLGRDAVRIVDVDARDRMRPDALERAVAEARARGGEPFMVVATVGTTGTGAIDPLPEIADICAREKLWMHADAAWGGAAAVSPRLARHVAGIERADSITCDAHKWISVSMGGGMFFTRHPNAQRYVFAVDTPYVPKESDAAPDGYASTLQWSRRFIGLKVFMTLALLGADGMAKQIEHHAEIADVLHERLEAAGWTIVSDSPLAVVCFTRDGIDVQSVAAAVVRSGRSWISPLVRTGRPGALRACVCNYETSAADVAVLVEELALASSRT
jgi:aromatic-L-amino-acid decarboxylase